MSPPSTSQPTSFLSFIFAFLFARTSYEPLSTDAAGIAGDSTDMRAETCAITEKVALYPSSRPEGAVQNVFTSWAKLSEAFSLVLAAEAVAETNRGLHNRHYLPTDKGFPPFENLSTTALLATIRLVLNGPYNEDMFELRLQRRPMHGNVPKPKTTTTNTSQYLAPWTFGQVLLIRFDSYHMRLQTSGSLVFDSESRKRPRDDYERPLENDGRIFYRHAIATGRSTLRFILSQHYSDLKETLFDLGARSTFIVPLGPSSLCGIRCYEAVADISPHLRQVKAIDALTSSAPGGLKDFLIDPRKAWQWNVQPGPCSPCLELSTRCAPAQNRVVITVANRLARNKRQNLLPGSDLPESHPLEWLSPKLPPHASETACIAVQGPPGTGKSTLLVEVLKSSLRETVKQFEGTCFLTPVTAASKISSVSRYAAESQPRILVTAPTNHAVDELLERVVTDAEFVTISDAFRQCSLQSDLDAYDLWASAKSLNVSSAVSSVLRSCLVVRVGRYSNDSRSSVKKSLMDAVVTETRNSARASHARICDEISRLDGQCDKRRERIEHLKSLCQKVHAAEAAEERGEAHQVSVDGEPCFLSGDFGQAVQYLENEIARHETWIDNVRDLIHHVLKREQRNVERLFPSFLHRSEGDTNESYDDVAGFVLENAVCVFATCDGAANVMLTKCQHKGLGFDLLLIDEAARASIPQLLVPLSQCANAKRSFDVVAVGDPAQTAATVISDDLEVRKVLGFSLLERSKMLSDKDTTLCWPPFRLNLLDRQFRLHPAISKFPREAFYDSKVVNGLPDDHFRLPWHLEEGSVTESLTGAAREWYREGYEGIAGEKFCPLILADTAAEECVLHPTHSGPYDTPGFYQAISIADYEGSRGNPGEALFVVKMISVLRRRLTDLKKKGRHEERWCSLSDDRDRMPTVLIQTPYKLQERIISNMLGLSNTSKQSNIESLERIASMFEGGDAWLGQWRRLDSEIEALKTFFSVHVLTIDSSIGREADIALVSRVVSETGSGTGFLSCPKRLCVSLTRASSLLVVVGPTKLAEGRINTKWDEFAQYCKTHGHHWPVSLVETDLDALLRK